VLCLKEERLAGTVNPVALLECVSTGRPKVSLQGAAGDEAISVTYKDKSFFISAAVVIVSGAKQ